MLFNVAVSLSKIRAQIPDKILNTKVCDDITFRIDFIINRNNKLLLLSVFECKPRN